MHHRHHHPLRRLAAATLATVVGAMTCVAVASLAETTAVAHAAGEYIDIKPASEKNVFWSAGAGNMGDVPLPDCGSINVAPSKLSHGNATKWRITSSIGSGSTVFVGQTWTVTAEIDTEVLYGGTVGNDGPDPLNLELKPTGYVKAAAAPVGAESHLRNGHNSVSWDGATGPKGPIGNWGYAFDSNSSPTAILQGGDGANGKVTVTLQATAEGEIDMKRFDVSGHDGTPKAGDIGCHIDLNWYWWVIPVKPAVANIDFAYVDSSYSPVGADDATSGEHGVLIDVLANDDDPNTAAPAGALSDLRIASWDSNMDCGDPALNGKTPTAANFDTLATGPCFFAPDIDDDLGGDLAYTVVQRSGLKQDSAEAIVVMVPNQPPTVSDTDVVEASGVDFSDEPIAGVVTDPDGDPLTCPAAAVDTDAPGAGVLTFSADCTTISWDSTSFAPVTVHATYEACDTHPTLQSGDIGDGGRAPGYDQAPVYADDLTPNSTRRCTPGTLTLDLQDQNSLVLGVRAANDTDKVDAGYPSDGNGPYNLLIPVLDNDALIAGPIKSLDVVLPPLHGTATQIGQQIAYTAGNNYAGPVSFKYKVCQPLTMSTDSCATATVNITVLGNKVPIAKPDDFGTVTTAPTVRSVVANDKEPELEALLCNTTLVAVNPPQAFSSISLGGNCQLAFDAADGYDGVASIQYKVCDNHHLTNPAHPAPGYGPFDIPGGNAPRCSIGTSTMDIERVEQLPPDPDAAINLPVCADDAAVTAHDVSVVVDVLANDSDLTDQGASSALTLVTPEDTQTEHGGSIAVVGNMLRYTPAVGYTGSDTGVYNVLDADGHGCSASLTVGVNGDPADLPEMPGVTELPATGSTSTSLVLTASMVLLAGVGLMSLRNRRSSRARSDAN